MANKDATSAAARQMLGEIARLDAAARGRREGHPSADRIPTILDRISVIRTHDLPEVSTEYVNVLMAHAATTQASLANTLQSRPGSTAQYGLLHQQLLEAIDALRRRCEALQAAQGGV